MKYWMLSLTILYLYALSIDAFAPRLLPSTIFDVQQRHYISSLSSSSTLLHAKLWDRLQIEEDPEPYWYLLNCVAGLELDLLAQCRQKCGDMPDAIKFVVPTELKTRSHGANRMVTEKKVKYQGYVFAKLRLCPQVYEAIQELDLCRSWMGTVNHKGYKKLPPAPVALNELEVENFGLEEYEEEEEEEEEIDEDAVIVDSEEEELQLKDPVDQEALKQYLDLKVEDMVKVTAKNKFYNEDGIVRRLKDGKILVRFFTYGTMYEEWMNPQDVRKLAGEELIQGLSGPSQPVTQRDFEEPKDNRDWNSRRNRGGLRQGLMSNVRGARGPRNTRRDRAARGDSYRRDLFGQTEEERQREERNWKWYQEQQRDKDSRSPVSGFDGEWNFQGQSRRSRDDNDDSALRDVDAQWGRQSQRERRRERRSQNTRETRQMQSAVEGEDDWSAFVSPAAAPASDSDEDDFFASLMDDLSDDLGPTSDDSGFSKQKSSPKRNQNDDDDDFFASLMSELSDEEGASSGSRSSQGTSRESEGEDDFFAALEAELGTAFEGTDGSDDSDDFFAQLEAELAPTGDLKSTDKEIFPEFDVSDFMEEPITEEPKIEPTTNDVVASPSTSHASSGDLSKNTVPQLKEMLRERGLKVSGKKSELIERLVQGQN